MNTIQRKVILSIAFAAVVYLGFSVWSSTASLKEAFSMFEWKYLPVILFLTFCNYLFRFQNWQYYLKTLGIYVPRKESFAIYIAGFSMAISPGKVGEVIRSVLLKQANGTPLSRTVSLTFVDRITDMIALVLIVAVGSFSFHYGQQLVWMVVFVILGTLGILIWRPLAELIQRALARTKLLGKHSAKLSNLYESAYSLLVPRRIIVIIILSLLGWSCEALGFYVTFLAFNIDANLGSALFIYAFSTIVGAVSLLPGGIGLTEGSIAGLLLVLNIGKGPAAAATLVIRACTLWFGVLLGSLFLIATQKRYGTRATEQLIPTNVGEL